MKIIEVDAQFAFYVVQIFPEVGAVVVFYPDFASYNGVASELEAFCLTFVIICVQVPFGNLR